MKIRFFVYLVCLSAMLFWSLSFIWYKEAYKFFNPFTTVFLRLFISSVVLFIISFFLRLLQPIKSADLKKIMLLAFFEPFLYFIGESLGLQWVSATSAAVIISIIPLLVPVLAYFMLNERLLVKNIIGIIISFFGVVMVVINTDFEIIVSLKGIGCLFLSVISATFYSVYLKKLTDIYNPITIVMWQNTIGIILFLPLMLIFEAKEIPRINLTFQAFLPIIKLALFASTLAFVFYAFAVQKLGAVKANIFTNLIPVLTACLSYFLLEEKLLIHNIIGIAIVISGLVLAQINPVNFGNKKIRPAKNETN